MKEVTFLKNELWYPAVSEYGRDMPYDEGTVKEVPLVCNPTTNQMQPLLLSSCGRALYREKGFIARFDAGRILVEDQVILMEGCTDLRGAFRYARTHWFAPEPMNISLKLVEKPLYNTWMYAPFHVTEDKVLAYAREILEQGFPAGTLIIDDMWSRAYGDWRFDQKKFGGPEGMLAKLHGMGFSVMVWVCPYVSFGTEAFRRCRENGLLLMEEEEPYALEWWNETSACLDLRKAGAVNYMREAFSALQAQGVDGFKLDGGDSRFYLESHEPDDQSRRWACLAAEYPMNEMRSEFHGAGLSLYERLADKRHSWGPEGVGAIIPDSLALGLSGHPFFSPDMIGGGEVKDIREGRRLKKDLFLAHCQMAALLPSLQFSILPREVLGEDMDGLYGLMETRERYLPYICALAQASLVSKEPLVRLMEYVFPGEGLEHVTQQFMLGDSYLVAPVAEEGQKEIEVALPRGQWYFEGREYEGGQMIRVPADLKRLVVMERKRKV